MPHRDRKDILIASRGSTGGDNRSDLKCTNDPVIDGPSRLTSVYLPVPGRRAGLTQKTEEELSKFSHVHRHLPIVIRTEGQNVQTRITTLHVNWSRKLEGGGIDNERVTENELRYGGVAERRTLDT